MKAPPPNGYLVLSLKNNPRKGWEEAFKKMATAGDDKLLDPEVTDASFDNDEWEWQAIDRLSPSVNHSQAFMIPPTLELSL